MVHWYLFWTRACVSSTFVSCIPVTCVLRDILVKSVGELRGPCDNYFAN